jgi:ketosteroid isomerase-like protein
MASDETRRVVDQLYDAYLGGDPAGMLATFSDDIAFRFLGQVDARGLDEARRFFAHSAELLTDLDFRIQRKVIDGSHAAVTWTETARTAAGAPWENHGVDVFEVREGKITSLHENNDVRLVHEHFERYEPAGDGNG